MDASTRILRALVVGEWLAVAAGLAVDQCLWGSLPEPLRSYEPSWDSLSWAVAAPILEILVVLPASIVASIGVFALWRPARSLYTAVTILGLAGLPAFGPAVTSAWSSLLYALSSLATGATLALLYLSPAARHFGKAPPEPTGGQAARDLLSSGALLAGGAALGFLAALGALVLAFLGFGVFVDRASRGASDAGRAYGTSRQDAECFAGARGYEPESAFASTSAFLSACLEAASPSDGFCNGVPAPDAKGSYAWQVARCEGDADPYACAFLQETVQEHCHRNPESL